jgi:hypothetical protein
MRIKFDRYKKVEGWWNWKKQFINYFKTINNQKKNDQKLQIKKLKDDEIEKKINFISYFK